MKYTHAYQVLTVFAVTALMLSICLTQAVAQSFNSYNTLFSGFTVTQSNNGRTFGFSGGNTVTIGKTSYALNDVRAFALLYSTPPSSPPSPIVT
jgi:hypothetical protein